MFSKHKIIRNGQIFELKMKFFDPSHCCRLWDYERRFPGVFLIVDDSCEQLPEMKSLYVRHDFRADDGTMFKQ